MYVYKFVVTSLLCNSSLDIYSDDFVDPLSTLLELSSDESSSDDHEVAALLHQKVVKVKKEINWDEEELQHQQKQKLKALRRDCYSDESDYEDAKWNKPPRPHKKRGRPKGATGRPSQQKACVASSKSETRLKCDMPVRMPHHTATDMSGYEDLNSTNCSFETCVGDDYGLLVSGQTSAPESDRDQHVTSTILSMSMCELGRGNDGGCCTNVSGTDNEQCQEVSDRPVASSREELNLISRVQTNELVSGYDTNFESEHQDAYNSQVLPHPEEDGVENSKFTDSEYCNDSGDYQKSSDMCAASEQHCVSEQEREVDCFQAESIHTQNPQCTCCDTAHPDHQQETRYYHHNTSSFLSHPHVHLSVQTMSCECCPSQHPYTPSHSHIEQTQCSCHTQCCPQCHQHCPGSTLSPNLTCGHHQHTVQSTFHGLPVHSINTSAQHCPTSYVVQEDTPTYTPPIQSLPSFGLDCCNTDGHCDDNMSRMTHYQQSSTSQVSQPTCNGSVANSNDLISSCASMNILTPRSKKRSLNDQDQQSSAPRNKRQCIYMK